MPDAPPLSVIVFELHFAHPHVARRAYVFPCDADGHVDLDALTDEARASYLYARVIAGVLPARGVRIVGPLARIG